MLQQTLQDALIAALKEKNTQKVSTLRYLQSTIKNKEIEKKTALSDDEIMQVIRKQIKELTDAKAMFARGGRADLVAENDAQIALLQAYLPAEISDEDLKREIEALIAANKETFEKNPKMLIGICMNALKSKAAPERILATLQSFATQ